MKNPHITWKELRKHYAKHLDSNPFEVKDIVECIDDTSSHGSKKLGRIYTVLTISTDNIGYTQDASASYKYFKLTDLSTKDWRDAFIEILNTDFTKVKYSEADTIQCSIQPTCSSSSVLLAYVSNFKSGGFWYGTKGLHFVTKGSSSAKAATYSHAKTFISQWKDMEKLE